MNVVPVHLPPLRDRGDDIILLAEDFLKQYVAEDGKDFQRFSTEVEICLRAFQWPGNVRQLQNVIRNIVVLHNGQTVQMNHLPPPLDAVPTRNPIKQKPQKLPLDDAAPASDIRPLAEVEREAIESAITFCDGNIPRAAALLEVSPSTIYRKKQSWENN